MSMQVLGKIFCSVFTLLKHGVKIHMFGFVAGLLCIPTDFDTKVASVWAS